MRKLHAVGVSVLFAAAVLSPLLRDPPRDSFPLSDYPMFSEPLAPTNSIVAVIGRGGDGSRHLLSPQFIGDSDEVMIALGTLRGIINEGAEATGHLCRSVAARVAQDSDEGIERIEVVTERYDTLAWFRGERDPVKVTLHADCAVKS